MIYCCVRCESIVLSNDSMTSQDTIRNLFAQTQVDTDEHFFYQKNQL